MFSQKYIEDFYKPQHVEPEVNILPVHDDGDIPDAWVVGGLRLVLDSETYSSTTRLKDALHPYKARVRLLQISDGKDCLLIDVFTASDSVYPKLKALLSNNLIIGQNIKFDVEQVANLFKLKTGEYFIIPNIADTMNGAKVLFGDYGKANLMSYSLKSLIQFFFPDLTVDKTEQTSNWGIPKLTKSQIAYALKDTVLTWLLFNKLVEEFLKEGLYKNTWLIENAIIPCTVQMQNTGFPISLKKVRQQTLQLYQIYNQLLKEWSDIVGSSCDNNKQLSLFGTDPDAVDVVNVHGLQYTQREKVIRHINKKYGLNLQKLDKEVLSDYTDFDIPELECITKLRSCKALLNNLEAFKRSVELSQNNDRVHTTFNTLTGTGRFSCGGGKDHNDLPNMQAICAREKLALSDYDVPNVREVIEAPKGKKFIILDYAASHARFAAAYSQDPTAILAMNDSSIDNHSKVAVFVNDALGNEWDWEYIAKYQSKKYRDCPDHQICAATRAVAKNVYYGWLNGAGISRLSVEIIRSVGSLIPEEIRNDEGKLVEVVTAARDGCKILYGRVEPWRNRLLRGLSIAWLSYVNGIYYHKVSTCDGFRLAVRADQFDKSVDVAAVLASLWSRPEATSMKLTVVKLFHPLLRVADIKEQWGLELVGCIHDELIIMVNEDSAIEAASFVNDVASDTFESLLNNEYCYKTNKWKKRPIFVSGAKEENPENLIKSSWAEK